LQTGLSSSAQLDRRFVLIPEQLNKGRKLRRILNQISISRDYNIPVLQAN
jgi:hypothetical protein